MKFLDFLLAPSTKFGFNYVPESREARNILFFFVFVRTILITFIVIFAIYPVFYIFDNTGDFGAKEAIFFSFIFVFFEEQSRWLFTASGENKGIEAYRFAILFTITESFVYYLGNEYGILDFLMARLSSSLMHLINSTICYLSFLYFTEYRVVLFLFSILIHMFFNLYLAGTINAMIAF